MVLAQPCERIARAAERGRASYPFPLLCDPDRKIVKAYGVWHPIGLDAFNTAHPAAFLIDAPNRRVRYAFVGRTQFERAPLDAILRAAGAGA